MARRLRPHVFRLLGFAAIVAAGAASDINLRMSKAKEACEAAWI